MKVGLQRSEMTRSVFENNISSLTRGTATADIWIAITAECQIWRKIRKNELNQVQMAPCGLIFNRGESYRV